MRGGDSFELNWIELRVVKSHLYIQLLSGGDYI